MKKFKIQNVSGAILVGLIVVSLVVFGMLFFGGETPVEQRLVADTKLSEPLYTNAILYWMYTLITATVVVTLLAFVAQFVATLKASPKAAFESLIGLVALVALLGITYSVGDDTPLTLVGYTGSDNVASWLKIGDMFIFSTAIMIVAMVALMIIFGVKKSLKL